MKTLKGRTLNIKEELLGKITTSPRNIFTRSKYIYVSRDNSLPKGYLAVIVSSIILSTEVPAVVGVSNIDELNEGDVVTINSKGEICVVYEIKSRQNAIFATGLCNHRCMMCPQPPILKEKDRTDFNLKLISLFDGRTEEVGITGGEPTLIGDKLFILIEHIQKKLPKAAINLLSNGVKFSEKEYAMKLAMCVHSDLQIDVPLFSDIASEHNRIVGAKTFYKTIEGLYNLAVFKQRIGLRIVIHKQTYKRLYQLSEFIYHNFPFIFQVAFMQMETIGLAETNLKNLWIDPYDYNEELEKSVIYLNERGIKAFIYNAQLCVLPRSIHSFAVQSISEWKNVYLTECDGCTLKCQCGGFFESNKKFHSKYIRKITTESFSMLELLESQIPKVKY
jgi:His-Xaa-Ser system radical SAM maturase HxsC